MKNVQPYLTGTCPGTQRHHRVGSRHWCSVLCAPRTCLTLNYGNNNNTGNNKRVITHFESECHVNDNDERDDNDEKDPRKGKMSFEASTTLLK